MYIIIILVNVFPCNLIIIVVTEGGRQIGPHACIVCQNVVDGSAHSRALPRSQASQYGLREDQVPPGARVCNTCRCKAVRGRYTACPLPGCPNLSSSKSRVKRLRALPAKWQDLPPEIREPIAQEFRKHFIHRQKYIFLFIYHIIYILFCDYLNHFRLAYFRDTK